MARLFLSGNPMTALSALLRTDPDDAHASATYSNGYGALPKQRSKDQLGARWDGNHFSEVNHMKIADVLQLAGRHTGLTNRRTLMAGAGIAATAAVAMKALPGAVPAAVPPAVMKAAPDTRGGYQLTAHVRRYYETAQA